MKHLVLALSLLITINAYSDTKIRINSDIRIEILSRIKVLEEKKETLKYELENADSEEKKYLIRKIKKVEEEIRNLQKILEEYEKTKPSIG
ncbi:hypothetical protein [Persephonella sp.]